MENRNVIETVVHTAVIRVALIAQRMNMSDFM